MRDYRIVRHRASIIVFALVLSFIASSVLGQEDLRTLKTKVADTLARFPAQTAEERNQLASEIIQLGSDGIQEICRMLVPPGTRDDSQVRFALNGVAVHVNRGGDEEKRH